MGDSLIGWYQVKARVLQYWKRLEPETSEILRKLPDVETFDVVDHMMRLAFEQTMRNGGLDLRSKLVRSILGDPPELEYVFSTQEPLVSEMERRRRQKRRGTKPTDESELLEIYERFLRSGLSQRAYIELNHVSRYKLQKACKLVNDFPLKRETSGNFEPNP